MLLTERSSSLAAIVLACPGGVNPAARPDPATDHLNIYGAAAFGPGSGIGGSGLTPPGPTKCWPGRENGADRSDPVEELCMTGAEYWSRHDDRRRHSRMRVLRFEQFVVELVRRTTDWQVEP